MIRAFLMKKLDVVTSSFFSYFVTVPFPLANSSVIKFVVSASVVFVMICEVLVSFAVKVVELVSGIAVPTSASVGLIQTSNQAPAWLMDFGSFGIDHVMDSSAPL